MGNLQIRLMADHAVPKALSGDKRSGAVRLWLIDETGVEVCRLLDFGGGAEELRSWFITNRKALLEERLPIGEKGGCSIAQAVAQFYSNLDPDSGTGNLVECVYRYRTSHSLRFALRGTDVDDIYVGLFGDTYEVSFCRGEDRWRHAVDLPSFLNEVRAG